MAASERRQMVAEQLERRGIDDGRVLAAFAAVPRDAFVSDDQRALAYSDAPLPIGHGQTISQPYVVAIMAQALSLEGGERVLEIGTGSGYAAAILGLLAGEVHTVERIAELAEVARERLARLELDNVHVHHADGTHGWPDAAPYDAIAVAAATAETPRALLDQLAIGGRLVIPLGRPADQRLARIKRVDESRYEQSDLGLVRFVPLIAEN